MELKKLYICYPGGNITAIIADPVLRKDQANISAAVMQTYNTGKPEAQQIEQVAFLEKTEDLRAVARLQMAGGEFSGNAAMCLGAIALKDKQTGLFEVSGSPLLLESSRSENQVSCEMPIPVQEMIAESIEGYAIVRLSGITHVLVGDFFNESETIQKEIGLNILKKNSLIGKDAVGVMFYQKNAKNISLKPFVYFEKGITYDLYKETSCGSGSTAIGIDQFLQSKNVSMTTEVLQPTGALTFVTVKKPPLKVFAQAKVQILYTGPLVLS